MKKITVVVFIMFKITFGNAQSINLFQGGMGSNNSAENISGTIFFSAINTAFITCNIIKLTQTDNSKSNAGFGIISGLTQATFGALLANNSNKDTKTLATINIGFGLGAIVTSGLRLLKTSPPKNKAVAFNPFYLPKIDNAKAIIGLSFIARIR